LRDAPYAAYRIGYELRGTLTNTWPVAVASASPDSGDVPLPVSFSAAGSTDPDGTVTSYNWDFGDGAVSTDANPAHTYTTGGPFVATLTVTDDDGAQATTTVFVKATAPNQLPVAHAGANPVSGPPPLDVTFYAAGSYDPDGSLGNFHWVFSDGGEYWGPVAYNTFTTPGPHTATLTVFDDRGGTASATVVINGNSVYLPLMRH
jgi:PKD repeat protein